MFLKSRTAKLGAIAVLAASVAVLAGCTTTASDDGASASGDSSNLAITFLPKNLGNAYFDTADKGGADAIAEFKRHVRGGGPGDRFAGRAGQLHQHADPAGRRSDRDLGERPDGTVRRDQGRPRRGRQDRDLRRRHQRRLPRHVHPARGRGWYREDPGRPDRRADRRRRQDRDPLGDGQCHEPERLDRPDEDRARRQPPEHRARRRGLRRRRRPDVVRQDVGSAADLPRPQGHHLAHDGRHLGGSALPADLGVQGQGRTDRSRHAEPDA